MKALSISFTFIGLLILLFAKRGVLTSKESEKQLTSLKLPPCQACKLVVDSFLKGMERTARNHFGGGDTAWEEAKLGSYATSEVRLVEVQEHLCEENRAKDQCLALAEDWDQHFEDWWLKHQKTSPDLWKYLCVDTVKTCCPDGHFGPNCNPCPGYPDRVCNNNGKCKGNGTRKGNGQCNCDEGFKGQFCDECAVTYYVSYRDDTKLLCSKCHPACKGACTQAGPKGCTECSEGWILDSEKGCLDIDECLASSSPCKENEFCINNEGSHSCLACDPSCAGCSGDGPDMCDKCASGYFLKDDMCIDGKDQGSYSDMTRYLTYFGLCVATCIIFQNRPMLASGVGLCVAIYVTVSEYMLNTIPVNNFFNSFFKYIRS